MTKRERERVRRAAAVIAITAVPRPVDADADRWHALLHWRIGVVTMARTRDRWPRPRTTRIRGSPQFPCDE